MGLEEEDGSTVNKQEEKMYTNVLTLLLEWLD